MVGKCYLGHRDLIIVVDGGFFFFFFFQIWVVVGVTGRVGHGLGLGWVYPNPTGIFYLWIFNFNIQLAPIPNCYMDFYP